MSKLNSVEIVGSDFNFLIVPNDFVLQRSSLFLEWFHSIISGSSGAAHAFN
jgi:hypothetical protein